MEKMSAVIGQVTAKAQEKHQQTEKHKLPSRARFKLQFIYKDGTYSPPYHSYDYHGKHIDERLGLVKLIQLVRKRRGEFVVASIFASLEIDPFTRDKEGKLTRHYNHIVYKEVNGRQPSYDTILSFKEGRMMI